MIQAVKQGLVAGIDCIPECLEFYTSAFYIICVQILISIHRCVLDFTMPPWAATVLAFPTSWLYVITIEGQTPPPPHGFVFSQGWFLFQIKTQQYCRTAFQDSLFLRQMSISFLK